MIETIVICDDLHCSMNQVSNDLEYAFYLSAGEQIMKKGSYSKEPRALFKLDFDRQEKHEITCFIKNVNGNISSITHEVGRLELDIQPQLNFNHNEIECRILMKEDRAMYAFYLYIDGTVEKRDYSKKRSFKFDINENKSFHEVRATYFVKDEFGNIYSDEIEYVSYKPEKNTDKMRDEFSFFLSKDRSTIYKIADSKQGVFSELLKGPGCFQNYLLVMSGEIFSEKMSIHVVKGFEVEPEGSYKSKFIDGYRLDLVYEMIVNYQSLCFPSKGERKKIKIQAKKLLDILNEEGENNDLIGDWALHNLIYSKEENRIFNIDLEGFITYNPLPDWCGIGKIRKWVEEFISVL
jgi:hypothetical protein